MAIKFLLHMHILKRFNYVVKRNPFLFPLLSHMSAVHNIMPPYFIQICFNICPESHRPFKWSVAFMFFYHKSMILSPPMCAMCLTHLNFLHLNILLFSEVSMFCHKKHRKYSNSSETEMETNCLPDEIMKQQSFISKNNWRCSVAVQVLWLVHT